MEIFKNKNPEKIARLKNSSVELRNNREYIINAVKKFGLEELKYVNEDLLDNDLFFYSLVSEVPQAASIIPETGKEELVLVAYQYEPESYKYLKPQNALLVRDFEKDCGVARWIRLGGESFKVMPSYWPGGKEEAVKNVKFIEKLDKMRPDVKELAEKRDSDNESNL